MEELHEKIYKKDLAQCLINKGSPTILAVNL